MVEEEDQDQDQEEDEEEGEEEGIDEKELSLTPNEVVASNIAGYIHMFLFYFLSFISLNDL